MSIRSFIRFALNGVIQEVSGSDVSMMLADYLRTRLFMTGTKIVCAEGDCGACTILRAVPGFDKDAELRFEPINSCITMMVQLDGSHVITVEGLSPNHELTSVQQAMVRAHGSQCGYCTPGFVMTLTGLFERTSTKPDAQAVKNHLTGNLCRCTGYSAIVDAALSVQQIKMPPLSERFVTKALHEALQEVRSIPVEITSSYGKVFAPATMEATSDIIQKSPQIKILGSGTDLGVQFNKGKTKPGDILSLHLIPELYKSVRKSDTFQFGSKVTLEEVRQQCARDIPEFSSLLNVFASPQIKNSATLVGNIVNASPIGDTLPFLLVADGAVQIASQPGQRRVPLTEFFKAYRQVDLQAGEWVESVSFRVPRKDEVLRLYKAATRKDLDIATVSAAFLFQLNTDRQASKPLIRNARIALGGVAAMPVRVLPVEEFLRGKTLDHEVMAQAQTMLQQAIKPLSDLRGTSAYRRILVKQFFVKYCDEVMHRSEGAHAKSHT